MPRGSPNRPRSTQDGPEVSQKFVVDGRLRTVERSRTTRYYPNPRRQFFAELEELAATHTKAELTDELIAMSERIEAWQETYEVADAGELRTMLDESLSVGERRKRERVVDD